MRPAWSLLIFTTLAGLAQGLLLGLVLTEWRWPGTATAEGFALVTLVALALLVAGLVASVFHLGRPSRAWRAASQWRTSWLSREVILLPALMAATALHALLLLVLGNVHAPAVRASGLLLLPLALGLWWCTGMIYACLRVLQDWATPLTPLAFGAIGLASGLLAAAGWAGVRLQAEVAQGSPNAMLVDASARGLAALAALALLLAALVKGAWWWRRRGLVLKSTLQSALGVRAAVIRPQAAGLSARGHTTGDYFMDLRSHWRRWGLPLAMVLAGALLPLLACLAALRADGATRALWPLLVLPLQLGGVLAERWLFFAWARHPQNLYDGRRR